LITNTLKPYLSAYHSSLSAVMNSITHTVAQKSRGKQLNAEVYSSETANSVWFSFFPHPLTCISGCSLIWASFDSMDS